MILRMIDFFADKKRIFSTLLIFLMITTPKIHPQETITKDRDALEIPLDSVLFRIILKWNNRL